MSPPSNTDQPPPIELPEHTTPPPGNCLPEVEYLRHGRFDLSDNILWSRRCVKPIWDGSNRDSIQNLTGPLIPPRKVTIDLLSCTHENIPPCEELPLKVPKPYPKKQYPNLVFGIASKYERIRESLPAIAHWLADTGASLVGIVADLQEGESQSMLMALEEEFFQWNITAKFKTPMRNLANVTIFLYIQ